VLTDEEYQRSASGAGPVLGEQALLELYLEWHGDDFWPSMLTPDRVALTGPEARKRGLRLGHCWGDHFVCFDGNRQSVLWYLQCPFCCKPMGRTRADMSKRFWLLTKQEYLIAKAARVAGRWSFRSHEEERLEEERAKAERKQRAQEKANARTRETERLARLSVSELAVEGIGCFRRKTDRTGRQLCLLVGKVPWVRELFKVVGGPSDHFRRECILEGLESLVPRPSEGRRGTEPTRAALLDWLYSDRSRADYVERVCGSTSAPLPLITLLENAQALERADVALVVGACASQLRASNRA